MKPIVVDAFEFVQFKEQREGEIPLSDLLRLKQECVSDSGTLHWTLGGGAHASGHAQLHLQVKGQVGLMCQRCMKPFYFVIASESDLLLAKTEAQADQIEAMLDDESVDVIVGSKTLNVMDLIEDEALLAIPQAPKHEQCPGVAESAESSGDTTIIVSSPFASLKSLRH